MRKFRILLNLDTINLPYENQVSSSTATIVTSSLIISTMEHRVRVKYKRTQQSL